MADRNLQWSLTLLPAFPLVLLVLRLWVLSRQDVQTMLVLVHDASPLGLVGAMAVTLVWVLPMVVLVGYALGALWQVSAPPGAEPHPSWLAQVGQRVPGWVVTLAVALAGLTWQMRFLPSLAMVTLAIVGLTVRHRYRDRPYLVAAACLGLPAAAALLAYAWLAAGIAEAFANGEQLNGLLLLLPPGLTLLLTGPVPASAAHTLTRWTAAGATLIAPFMVGAIFLRAPVLPLVALEVDDGGRYDVVLGYVVAVDDRMTTLLDRDGSISFVPNDAIASKTLCPDSDQIPRSTTQVRGWHVEHSALTWLAPSKRPAPEDPRCQGRPVDPAR